MITEPAFRCSEKRKRKGLSELPANQGLPRWCAKFGKGFTYLNRSLMGFYKCPGSLRGRIVRIGIVYQDTELPVHGLDRQCCGPFCLVTRSIGAYLPASLSLPSVDRCLLC